MGYADTDVIAEYAARRPALPFVTFVVLPDIALACIMALRPPFVIRVGASLLLLYAAFYATATYTTGTPVDDYSLGSTIFGNMVLNIMLLTWLTDPVNDFRYVKDPAPLTARPLFKRIWYAFCIIRNYRLIGTNVQVANVPAPFKGTRSQFLLRRLRQLLVCIVSLDLVESWIHTHHHLYMPETAHLHFPATPLGYLARSACIGAWLFMCYTVLKLSYVVCSMVAVATQIGNGDPEDWPDLFGTWSDAYTVRHLWGRAWHQNLRRHFSHWGKLTVRALGIPRGTWLSSQVQIHVAFGLSALLHCMGDLMIDRAHFGRSFAFFAANGLAITLEDTVFALAKRAGLAPAGRPSRALRVLGYLWVYVWCTWSGPLYQGWMFESKVGLNDILPYSPTRSIILPAIRSITGYA
ncbi:hypothetical protein GY45DRAFT_1439337 [Cubamyces sp. BRFM 1775]|nr:hypothetical protein GY45DRAFT_1439337 [Cubamyces sp. BRFM 1775]